MSGFPIIDNEHKQLFDAINKLLDVFSSKKEVSKRDIAPVASFLENYVEKHFAHEEELQKKYDWREMEMHCKFHEDYKATLKEILDSIPEEGPDISVLSALNTHIVRLITHIRTMDKRLGSFLKEKVGG